MHTREIDKAIRAAEHDLDAGVNAKWSHLLPASINNMYQKCGYRSIPVYARILAEGKVNAVRSTVANQLCLLGDPRCLPPLVQKLTSDDDWVSADVVGFMPMMPHRAVVTAITPLLHDQENWMKAVHILSHTSDRKLIPELAALAKREGDGVRQEMIEKAMESIQRQAQARDAAMESWKRLQNKSMQATPNGAPDG